MSTEKLTRKILSELDIDLPTLDQYQKVEKIIAKIDDNETLTRVIFYFLGCGITLLCWYLGFKPPFWK